MGNIFNQQDVQAFVARVDKLTADSKPQWGGMSVDKMLAHCNVAYEMALENNHPKPGKLKIFLIKSLIKPMVCTEKPYKKNGRTHPAFVIVDERNFETEKTRLINYLNNVQKLGEKHFDNKESHSMGKLTVLEWNNMFSKHLNHHLAQFGV
jgi:hypothetical protein